MQGNPYCLADDIWGIGFKTADGIALKLGYENNDPRRCRSGILYTLSQLSDEGHVYAEREQLIAAAKTLLQAEEQPITETLNQMIAAEDVILDRIDSTEGGTLNIGLSAGIPMAAEDSPLMAADEILENFVKTGP